MPKELPMETQETKGFFYLIEKILALAFLSGIAIRETLDVRFDGLFVFFGGVLAVAYLIANWWFDKPVQTNRRTIFVNILYELSSCVLIFAITFQELFLVGSWEMSILAFIILFVTVVIDFITARNRAKTLNDTTIWRLAILTSIVAALFFIPQDKRIAFTYRKHPSFVKHWIAEKGKIDFNEFKEKYYDQLK